MAVSAQFMLNMSGLLGCWDWDVRFILRSAGPCESRLVNGHFACDQQPDPEQR